MMTSRGKIVYNPIRKMDKNVDWWCVLELTEDFTRNLRWHLEKNWYLADSHSRKRNYSRPSHSPHCSIIRGERIKRNIEDWNFFMKGSFVEFQYDLNIRQTNETRDGKDYFFFIDVIFPEYNIIREHFGLDTQRDGISFKGHVTLARCYG